MTNFGLDYGNDNYSDAKFDGGGGGVVPTGWYDTMIVKAEVKTSNAGLQYINVEHAITQGEFKNRRIFQPFYINSQKADFANAQKRAFGKLSLLHGLQVNSSEQLGQLRDKHQRVKVKVEPAKGEYEAKNKVVDMSPIGEGATTVSAPAGGPAGDGREGW